MKLNQKILYCRKKARLSQEALAEQLGVSRQAVSKWETGDAVPEISKLLLLAKVFDVTTDWLLSEEEPEDAREESREQDRTKEERREQDRAGWSSDTTNGNMANENTANGNTTDRSTVMGSNDTANRSTAMGNSDSIQKKAEDWMDAVPGILGKMVKRFGWIAGVYIAVCGAGLAGVGALAKIILNSMLNSFNNAASSMMPGFGGDMFGQSTITFYDENGNRMNTQESAELLEILEGSGSSIFDSGSSGYYFMDSGISIMENNPVSIMAMFMIIAGLIMMVAGIAFAVIWRKKSRE